MGETDSGRSSSALSSDLPGKSYRTSRSEMPTPKSVLRTTTCTATDAVSWRAKTTLGSDSAVRRVSRPSANAPSTTRDTGQPTRRTRYTTTSARSPYRTPREPSAVRATVEVSATAGHPSLDELDRRDDEQRHEEEDGRDGRGLRG